MDGYGNSKISRKLLDSYGKPCSQAIHLVDDACTRVIRDSLFLIPEPEHLFSFYDNSFYYNPNAYTIVTEGWLRKEKMRTTRDALFLLDVLWNQYEDPNIRARIIQVWTWICVSEELPLALNRLCEMLPIRPIPREVITED